MPQPWDFWTVALTKNRPADRSLGGYFGATSLEDEKMKTKVGRDRRDETCPICERSDVPGMKHPEIG